MKRALAVLAVVAGIAGCGDSQQQAAKDAGYMLRMNQVVCHIAGTELEKVSAWLEQVLKDHPDLAVYAKKGETEADAVHARHQTESDGAQKDRSECEKVRSLAASWSPHS
ncbi:MAG: hypothetical protein WBW32_11680 [Luteibacter sp.]